MHASKNVSTFEINIFYYFCLWAPLLFLTQSKETVSWCCFYIKNKILAILFLVKYVKNHTFWSVFSVVGAHNLHVQMRKRNKIKTLKHTHSSLISMVIISRINTRAKFSRAFCKQCRFVTMKNFVRCYETIKLTKEAFVTSRHRDRTRASTLCCFCLFFPHLNMQKTCWLWAPTTLKTHQKVWFSHI